MTEQNLDSEAVCRLKEYTNEQESKLRDRFIYLALDLAPGGRGTYKYLEERTAIPATRWKNVILKKQMPTLSMLIGLMQYRASYATWLLTGREVDEGDDFFPAAPSKKRWVEFLKHQQWTQEQKNGANKDE